MQFMRLMWHMRKSLPREFNKTAAAAQAAFPVQLKRLTVLLVPTSTTPLYVAPAVAEKLTQDTAGVKKAVAALNVSMQKKNWVGLADRYKEVAGTKVNLIALNGNDFQKAFREGDTKGMWALYVLDHELGHHVTKKGLGYLSGQVRESSADAYAALRHIQRFGKHTVFAIDKAERMSANIVLQADTAHYTTDTIERAVRVAEETDISKLSLRETAALAQKIADEAHLGERTLKKIRTAYRPVNRLYRKQIGAGAAGFDDLPAQDGACDLICRAILAVMRDHAEDADIFRAGKRFLTSYVGEFMQRSAKTDAFYGSALDFLDSGETKALYPAPRKAGVSRVAGKKI